MGTARGWDNVTTETVEFRVKGKQPDYYFNHTNIGTTSFEINRHRKRKKLPLDMGRGRNMGLLGLCRVQILYTCNNSYTRFSSPKYCDSSSN